MIVVYNILWFKKWRWEIENPILSEWFLYENIFKKLPISDPAEAVRKFFKTPQEKGFYFLFQKNLVLTGKKHCGESRRCRNASAGPVSLFLSLVAIFSLILLFLDSFECLQNLSSIY